MRCTQSEGCTPSLVELHTGVHTVHVTLCTRPNHVHYVVLHFRAMVLSHNLDNCHCTNHVVELKGSRV